MKNQINLIVFLLMSLGCVYAGQEPVLRNSMSGNVSLVADSFRVIEDIEYTNSNLGDYELFKADNYVNLEINQDQISDCFLDSFWFSAQLEVTGWDEYGSTTVETITLDVYYNQLLGKEYKAIATKHYSDFYKLQIKIVSVSNAALTPYIRISGEIAIERYKSLDVSTLPTISSSSYSSTTGNITVSWAGITGAEEYDLEYLYLDDYPAVGTTAVSTSNLIPEFRNNATRVTISQTSYSFSNIFDRGYVVFRVRPVGRAGDQFTHVIKGRWSEGQNDSKLLLEQPSRPHDYLYAC